MPYVIGKLVAEQLDSYPRKDGTIVNFKRIAVQENPTDLENVIIECKPDFKVTPDGKGQVTIKISARAGSIVDGQYRNVVVRYSAA